MITPETPDFEFSKFPEWERFRKELLLDANEFADFLGITRVQYRQYIKDDDPARINRVFPIIRKLYALEYALRIGEMSIAYDISCPHCGKQWKTSEMNDYSLFDFQGPCPGDRKNIGVVLRSYWDELYRFRVFKELEAYQELQFYMHRHPKPGYGRDKLLRLWPHFNWRLLCKRDLRRAAQYLKWNLPNQGKAIARLKREYLKKKGQA